MNNKRERVGDRRTKRKEREEGIGSGEDKFQLHIMNYCIRTTNIQLKSRNMCNFNELCVHADRNLSHESGFSCIIPIKRKFRTNNLIAFHFT